MHGKRGKGENEYDRNYQDIIFRSTEVNEMAVGRMSEGIMKEMSRKVLLEVQVNGSVHEEIVALDPQ